MSIILEKAPPIMNYSMETAIREKLDLTGFPSIDEVGKSMKDLRDSYLGWMHTRLNTSPPFCNLTRAELYQKQGRLIEWVFHKKHQKGDRLENFRASSIGEWRKFARQMLFMNDDEVLWNGIRPFIRENKLMQMFEGKNFSYLPMKQIFKHADHTFVKHQFPIRSHKENDTVYYEFDHPNLYYYLLTYNYSPPYNLSSLQKIDEDGLLKPEFLQRVLPVISFLAEEILLTKKSLYPLYIKEMAKKIGGEEGIAVATAIVQDHWNVYQPFLDKGIPFYALKKPREIFTSVLDNLRKEYKKLKYENREQIITKIALENSLSNPDRFWDELFDKSGVKQVMEELFLNNEDEEILSIYETALRERKIIPGLVMMLSHILGYETEKSKQLAAAALFGWGVIVSYDNIVDGHTKRKNAPTDLINDGLPRALNKTMLGLSTVLQQTLSDQRLTSNFLEMLRVSCRGDNAARVLGWDNVKQDYLWNNTSYDHLEIMSSLVAAFSWFPEYIGQQTGFPEEGQNLSEILSHFHTLGQMNNDIEDIEKGLLKHDEGNDIGRRKTLFWETLVQLPDEVVSNEEKETVKNVYRDIHLYIQSNGYSPNIIDYSRIVQVLEIGRKYKKFVVQVLHPIIKERIFEPAKSLLTQMGILSSDKTNSIYKNILLSGLEQEWGKFCRAGEIEE